MSEIFREEVIPEDGVLDFTTSEIIGEINHIVIHNHEAVGVDMHTVQHGTCLFKTETLNAGTHYLPIRIRPVNSEGEGFTQGAFVKYVITGELRVIVKGVKGKSFSLWINFNENG